MKISNRPPTTNGIFKRAKATACVNGINLLIAPVSNACFSSGFGHRGRSFHKGIDYHHRSGTAVYAAAPGKIIEMKYRPMDFGKWLILDHGNNVYSAYAHLASYTKNMKKGDRVTRGQKLGIMGKTGAAARAIHLHYEVRLGKLGANISSYFKLKSVDLIKQPAHCR